MVISCKRLNFNFSCTCTHLALLHLQLNGAFARGAFNLKSHAHVLGIADLVLCRPAMDDKFGTKTKWWPLNAGQTLFLSQAAHATDPYLIWSRPSPATSLPMRSVICKGQVINRLAIRVQAKTDQSFKAYTSSPLGLRAKITHRGFRSNSLHRLIKDICGTFAKQQLGGDGIKEDALSKVEPLWKKDGGTNELLQIARTTPPSSTCIGTHQPNQILVR